MYRYFEMSVFEMMRVKWFPFPYKFYHFRCHINCLSKVAVTSNLQLVPDLSDKCQATFNWRLQKRAGSYYGSYIDLDPITETGEYTEYKLSHLGLFFYLHNFIYVISFT